MDDMYNCEEPEEDSLYTGAPSGEAGFRRFLRLAENQVALLPSWWSSQKAADSLQFGRTDKDLGLRFSIEKSDIQESYGNSYMPMQLRMFAEQVYGSGPGGQNGAAMMGLMMSTES